MPWLTASLTRKFAAGTAAGLLLSSLVFLVLFVGLYRAELEQERTGSAVQLNRLLQASLENAMLKRDIEGLKGIVERLGTQPDIRQVMITNPAGEVRFSSDPTLLGRWIPPPSTDTIHGRSDLVQVGDDEDLLRSINPVHNKPACQECHVPMAFTPINGILYVDYDAAPLRAHARRTTLLLMGSGALIVVINLAGGWWFLRRQVLVPVAKLAAASACLCRGDLGARVGLQGRDELAALGETFDSMAGSLQGKIRELEEGEQFLQQLLDAIPDGVRIIDPDYRVVLANDTYRRQLGLDPEPVSPELCHVAAHGLEQPCPPTLVTCPLREIALRPESLRVVHQHRRQDGSTFGVDIYAAPLRVTRNGVPQTLVVESIRDLESQVRFSHEHKLSELGRLAAGVAHEIYNPLAAVRLGLHEARRASRESQPDLSQVTALLKLVDQEIDQCIQVTQRLLKLSIPPPALPELVDLEPIARETLSLLNWEAEARGVHMELHCTGSPLRLLASDSELRMLVLNLAQNALHAMPKGGTLEMSGHRRGDRVELIFRDSGLGIAPVDLPQIFNPFFSRRADGVQGTGLGLSIVRAILEKYSGRIRVESRLGEGSRFEVDFPDPDASNRGSTDAT